MIVCFAEFVGLRHAHAPTGANVKNFSLSADGVLFVLLEKGKRPTFSLSERKSCKKKQTSLLLDLLANVEALSTKARSLFANAYLKVHSLLGERNFAVHGSLSL